MASVCPLGSLACRELAFWDFLIMPAAVSIVGDGSYGGGCRVSSGRGPTFAVLTPSVGGHYHGKVARGIARALREVDGVAIVIQTLDAGVDHFASIDFRPTVTTRRSTGSMDSSC